MKKFIVKLDSSNYYLLNLGYVPEKSRFDPKNNPEESFSIILQRGGFTVNKFSLREASTHPNIPSKVKETALQIIRDNPPEFTEEWEKMIYDRLGRLYSNDGESSGCGLLRPSRMEFSLPMDKGFLS